MYRKFFGSFGILLIASLPFLALLRPGYFPMHDDMQAMRVLQMRKCFADWQIPCRWVPDMGYGYGYPQFNYYPPLPYYLMTLISFAGVSILDSVKIGFILTFIISGLGMFLLGRQLWGTVGGILSSLFYLYLPYRAVNVYVRGAMGEIWAMAWFPWILWSLEGYFRQRKWKYLIYLALSLMALALSHLLSAMMIAPFLIVWALWRLISSSRRTSGPMVRKRETFEIKNKTLKVLQPWIPASFDKLRIGFAGMTKIYLVPLSLSAVLALGLSAFYILPVIFEGKYAHLETLLMGYFNYLAHYVGLKQIFISTYWSYGSSIFGPNDGMSLAIGLLHWLIPLISFIIGMVVMLNSFQHLRDNSVGPETSSGRQKFAALVIILLSAFSYLFLLHPRSTPIWLALKPFEYLQFPWRFLAPAGFLFSLAAGSITIWELTPPKPLFQKEGGNPLLAGEGRVRFSLKSLLIIIPLILLNLSNFRPEKWFHITDADHFAQWEKLQTISIFDYLPIAAEHPPTAPAPDQPSFISGDGKVLEYHKGSDWQAGTIEVSESGELRLPLFDFPGMKASVDGQTVSINNQNELGLITIPVAEGIHQLFVRLDNTPDRTVGNIISLVSISILFLLILVSIKRDKVKSDLLSL